MDIINGKYITTRIGSGGVVTYNDASNDSVAFPIALCIMG